MKARSVLQHRQVSCRKQNLLQWRTIALLLIIFFSFYNFTYLTYQRTIEWVSQWRTQCLESGCVEWNLYHLEITLGNLYNSICKMRVVMSTSYFSWGNQWIEGTKKTILLTECNFVSVTILIVIALILQLKHWAALLWFASSGKLYISYLSIARHGGYIESTGRIGSRFTHSLQALSISPGM